MDAGNVEIAAGTRVRETVSCSFPEDVFILSMTWIMLNWDEGAFPVAATDQIDTSCEWFNSGDFDLEPLQEMCTTFDVLPGRPEVHLHRRCDHQQEARPWFSATNMNTVMVSGRLAISKGSNSRVGC